MTLRSSLVLKLVPEPGNTLSVVLTSILILRPRRSAARFIRDRLDELEGLGQRIPPLTREIRTLEGIRGGTLAGVGATEDHALVDACFLLLQHAGRMWIGVGAHHPVEAAESPTLNSPEPISENRLAASWWAYEDVADHWDELTLRTYRGEQRSGWEAIQVSTLNDGDRPEQLLKSCHPSGSLPEGTMLFCAIAAAPARLSSGLFVRCELQDEALGRQIRLDYRRR